MKASKIILVSDFVKRYQVVFLTTGTLVGSIARTRERSRSIEISST